MNLPRVSMIAAIGLNKELGKGNDLIWRIPADMKRFVELTTGHSVIMGRKTFESIPEKFRPLANRTNIIVSTNASYDYKDTYVCKSLEDALKKAREFEKEEIFIIGGGQIYSQGIQYSDKLYLTIIEESTQADVFFPDYKEFQNKTFEEKGEHKGIKYTWINLEK